MERNLCNCKDRIHENNHIIRSFTKNWQNLQEQFSSLELSQKQEEKQYTDLEKQKKNTLKSLNDLVLKNKWIIKECQFLHQFNMIKTFSRETLEKLNKELLQKEREYQKIGRRINKNATIMYEKIEEDFSALSYKKAVVMSDKKTIERVIVELDYRKRIAIKKAWDKVNLDFGSIFNTLLPGASAKLSESKGKSYVDGLEIKVAFENVWKTSLKELSGGQSILLNSKGHYLLYR
jgi:structural maintenance of chromosome 2